jgi:hypothetical protein
MVCKTPEFINVVALATFIITIMVSYCKIWYKIWYVLMSHHTISRRRIDSFVSLRKYFQIYMSVNPCGVHTMQNGRTKERDSKIHTLTRLCRGIILASLNPVSRRSTRLIVPLRIILSFVSERRLAHTSFSSSPWQASEEPSFPPSRSPTRPDCLSLVPSQSGSKSNRRAILPWSRGILSLPPKQTGGSRP